MNFPIIIFLFILISAWVCKAQDCTKRENFPCNQVGTDSCRAYYSIEISYNEDAESTEFCAEVMDNMLEGEFRIKCIDTNQCFRMYLETECASCVEDVTQDRACFCNCTVGCIATSEGREEGERTAYTMVTSQTTTQTPRSTVVIETKETTKSISTTITPTTVTNSSSLPTTTDQNTRQTSVSTINNNTRPSSPVNLPQYLLYGLPIGVILIIFMVALLIATIVCLCCRRMRSKVKDVESDIIAINTRNATPENEPTYSSISETIHISKSTTDNNNNNINNDITSRRSENVYSQIESSMSLSEVTTPNGMVQNVLYNAFVTEADNTNNTYHVLVADDVTDPNIERHYMSMIGGEVINPSMYEKIPSLQSIDRANNVQGGKRESKIYIEPPRNLSELKEMPTVCLYELRAEDVEMGEEFASGQFGVVYRGKYRTSVGDVPVAIKTLKETVDANKDMRVAFMREAAILAQFHHPNVLRLIGIVTTQQPWMMITELLKTELRQLLLQIRPAMLLLSSSPSPSASSPPDKLRIHTLLLNFSQQIAAGMEHLAEKKFIHRDLAARNVLVAKDLSVRVADFGMSREIDSDNDYYSSSGGRVPLRWTSPEALFYKKYSEKSDVWSFGMTLYEIWSLGDKPWEGCKNDKVIEAITNGRTPLQPVNCSDKMYLLMLQTWIRDKDSRPTFSQLKRQLSLIKIQ